MILTDAEATRIFSLLEFSLGNNKMPLSANCAITSCVLQLHKYKVVINGNFSSLSKLFFIARYERLVTHPSAIFKSKYQGDVVSGMTTQFLAIWQEDPTLISYSKRYLMVSIICSMSTPLTSTHITFLCNDRCKVQRCTERSANTF